MRQHFCTELGIEPLLLQEGLAGLENGTACTRRYDESVMEGNFLRIRSSSMMAIQSLLHCDTEVTAQSKWIAVRCGTCRATAVVVACRYLLFLTPGRP